jgi:hypothetical protein
MSLVGYTFRSGQIAFWKKIADGRVAIVTPVPSMVDGGVLRWAMGARFAVRRGEAARCVDLACTVAGRQ